MEYLIFIFIELFLLLSKNIKKYTEINFKLMIILIFLFSSIRFDLGQDYQSYYRIGIGSQLWDYVRFEPISKLFYQIVWYLEMPQVYFILSSGITLYFIYKAVNYRSYDKMLSVYVYISLFLIASLSTIRQSMAEAYLIYISRLLFIDIKCYLFFIFLGLIFHKSILIACMFILLIKLNLKRRVLLILNFSYFYGKELINILKVIPITIVKKLLNNIDSYLIINGGGEKWIYIYMFINVLLILNRRKYLKTKEENGYLNIVVTGTFFYGILTGLTGIRVGMYFFTMYLFLIPIYYKKSSKIIKVFIISFLTFIFIIQIYIGRNNLVPYKYIFFQNDKIIFRDDETRVYYLKKINIDIEKLKWRIK